MEFKLHVAGLNLGQVEDIVDEGKQCFPRMGNTAGVTPLFLIEIAFQKQARHAKHSVHGGANLVGHIGQKLTFGRVRSLGCIARVAKFKGLALRHPA